MYIFYHLYPPVVVNQRSLLQGPETTAWLEKIWHDF